MSLAGNHQNGDLKVKLLANLFEAQARLHELCVPVYRSERGGRKRAIGSATLIDIATRTFLVTAAHVLDDFRDAPILISAASRLEISGISYRTSAKSGSLQDRIDLGILEIPPNISREIAATKRVSAARLDPADSPSPLSVSAFVGYPASRNKMWRGHASQPSSLVVMTREVANTRYSEVGATPGIHLVAEFKQKDTMTRDGTPITAPSPHGMSGGGVWRLGTLPEFERSIPRAALVGIGIEFHARPGLLVAIRTPFLTASLIACDPQLESHLPKVPANYRIRVRK